MAQYSIVRIPHDLFAAILRDGMKRTPTVSATYLIQQCLYARWSNEGDIIDQASDAISLSIAHKANEEAAKRARIAAWKALTPAQQAAEVARMQKQAT